MLDMKHFNLLGEEYVVLKKDTLEDALFTAVTLVSMLEQNYNLLRMGSNRGNPNFDISKVEVGDLEFWAKHSVNYMTIVNRVLENL